MFLSPLVKRFGIQSLKSRVQSLRSKEEIGFNFGVHTELNVVFKCSGLLAGCIAKEGLGICGGLLFEDRKR